ncbi:MAG: DUF4440 domain-containing protein [Hyphomonadaceae bacterium]
MPDGNMKPLSRRALAQHALLAAPLAAAGLCAGAAEADAQIPASFEWAVEAHLRAIRARDLEALMQTLTRDEELLLILPSGQLTRTKTEYLAFHREWFSSPSWTMDFEELWRQTTLGLGQALFRTRYADTRDDGSPYVSSSYLMLTFKREGASWRLWTDQNTRIPNEA